MLRLARNLTCSTTVSLLDGFNDLEFRKRENKATEGLCEALTIPNLTEKSNSKTNEQLLHLSAFMSASNYWNTELPDIAHWPEKSFHDPIREVFKGISLASGISRTDLHIDAVALLDTISSSDTFDSHLAMYDRTVYIDIEPDWDTINHSDLDSKRIEQAMYCEVKWIVFLAGNLLLKLHDRKSLSHLIKGLLKNGEYTTLLITSYMIPLLKDNDKIRSIIVDRLKGKLIPGCQFLYAPLAEAITALDKDLIDIVSKGLFKSGPRTATEAAKLASKFAALENELLYKVLIDAYKFWIKNEEPYPVENGVIPESPRKELLAAVLKMKVPTDNDLMAYLSDSRSDVRDVAKKHLASRIEADRSLREKLISATNEEIIDPIYLSTTIKNNTTFSPLQIDSICEMINHKSSKVRYSAFNILKTNHVTKEALKKWLGVAMNDSNREIRESAVLLESKL